MIVSDNLKYIGSEDLLSSSTQQQHDAKRSWNTSANLLRDRKQEASFHFTKSASHVSQRPRGRSGRPCTCRDQFLPAVE